MKRFLQGIALVGVAVAGIAQVGCRACGTCHDYSPPVADCHCNACGGGRSGSVSTHGYAGTDNAADAEAVIAQKPTDAVTK
ncbi:MAG: hypothetical protein AAF589_03805 [Planctomycetota bacterium]